MHEQKFETFEHVKNAYRNGKLPSDIPVNVKKVYKSEFKSMGDWLGTGRVADKFKIFKTYNEAKKYIHPLNILSAKDWGIYAKSGSKPEDIPSGVARFYKNSGWIDWHDFLGKKNGNF